MVRFPVPQKERKKTKGSADDDAKAINVILGLHTDTQIEQKVEGTNNRTDRLIYIILMMKYVKKNIVSFFGLSQRTINIRILLIINNRCMLHYIHTHILPSY